MLSRVAICCRIEAEDGSVSLAFVAVTAVGEPYRGEGTHSWRCTFQGIDLVARQHHLTAYFAWSWLRLLGRLEQHDHTNQCVTAAQRKPKNDAAD